MLTTRATHEITRDALAAWLLEHSLNIEDVITAVIRVDYTPSGTWEGVEGPPGYIGGWLDVTFNKKDADGAWLLDETGNAVAQGSASIPLHSWPELTPH